MLYTRTSQIPQFTEYFIRQSGFLNFSKISHIVLTVFSSSGPKVNYIGTRKIKFHRFIFNFIGDKNDRVGVKDSCLNLDVQSTDVFK